MRTILMLTLALAGCGAVPEESNAPSARADGVGDAELANQAKLLVRRKYLTAIPGSRPLPPSEWGVSHRLALKKVEFVDSSFAQWELAPTSGSREGAVFKEGAWRLRIVDGKPVLTLVRTGTTNEWNMKFVAELGAERVGDSTPPDVTLAVVAFELDEHRFAFAP
jgi:hypothetical protein